jgi:ERCC4-type nuclease
MATANATTPIACPFAVLVDRREQRPFSFAGLTADARQGRRPVLVTLVPATLGAGDYSLAADGQDYGNRVAIERKSLADLYGTLGQHRGRFEQELARLQRLDFAAVVVEADWNTIIRAPPERSRLRPKVVYRSVLTWMQRYPKVHWVMCPGRQFAEVTTFRLLERWWKDNVRRRRVQLKTLEVR